MPRGPQRSGSKRKKEIIQGSVFAVLWSGEFIFGVLRGVAARGKGSREGLGRNAVKGKAGVVWR